MSDAPRLDPLQLAIPPTESPFFERFLATVELSDGDRALMREFSEKGYVVVDAGIDDFDALAARVIAELAPHYTGGVHRRVAEAWYFSDDVRRIAAAPKLLATLHTLYQRRAIPFQTLNFDRGTEQPAHSDTLHFNSVPRRYMCGVWVALEDIDADSGPLVVYPGSHMLPDFDMHDLGLELGPEHYEEYERLMGEVARAKGFEEVAVTPKKGQAIVWAANLLHGGQAVRNPEKTRQSQVTHYYFEDGLYYFPMSSDPYTKSPCMREVIDLSTGRFIAHRHRGVELDLEDFFLVWSYPRPLPEWVDASSVVHAKPESSDVSLPVRVQLLKDTVASLRAEADVLRAIVADRQSIVDELQRARDGMLGEAHAHRAIIADREAELKKAQAALHELLESRFFKLAHGVKKTLRRLRPKTK
jgi:hypothetical protein